MKGYFFWYFPKIVPYPLSNFDTKVHLLCGISQFFFYFWAYLLAHSAPSPHCTNNNLVHSGIKFWQIAYLFNYIKQYANAKRIISVVSDYCIFSNKMSKIISTIRIFTLIFKNSKKRQANRHRKSKGCYFIWSIYPITQRHFTADAISSI